MSLLPWAEVGVALLVVLSTFIVKLVKYRLAWRRANLPGPPHDFLWGHFPAIGKINKLCRERYGRKAHADYMAIYLNEQYGPIVGIDWYPFARPMLVVSDPAVADRIVRGDNLPKCLEYATVNYPILTEKSIVLAKSDSAGNQHWQIIRRALAPGFRKRQLERSWTSDIVEQVNEMVERLENSVKNDEVLNMVACLTDTTCDIILRIVISSTDQALRKQVLSVLNAQLDNAMSAHHMLHILDTLNPVRRYGEWTRSWQMNALLGPIVDEHITAKRRGNVNTKMDVVDCALAENDLSRDNLLAQVRTFIFAGHDTTSVALAWTYYHLAQDPGLLAKVREELDTVFGKHPGGEVEKIIEDPLILNQLKFINALLKETLRLYPPGASARQSPDGYSVHSPKANQTYNIGNMMLYICHATLHRDPDTFPNPTVFKPERWMDEEGEATPAPSAWQPFSRGPKNCIGMELALLEQRILLAMTVRKFDFEYADKTQPYNVFRLTGSRCSLEVLTHSDLTPRFTQAMASRFELGTPKKNLQQRLDKNGSSAKVKVLVIGMSSATSGA